MAIPPHLQWPQMTHFFQVPSVAMVHEWKISVHHERAEHQFWCRAREGRRQFVSMVLFDCLSKAPIVVVRQGSTFTRLKGRDRTHQIIRRDSTFWNDCSGSRGDGPHSMGGEVLWGICKWIRNEPSLRHIPQGERGASR